MCWQTGRKVQYKSSLGKTITGHCQQLNSLSVPVKSPLFYFHLDFGRHGSTLQYSSLEHPHGQRSLAGYSPWRLKEWDMPQQTTHSTVQKLKLIAIDFIAFF